MSVAAATVERMLAKRVVSVKLSFISEAAGESLTSFVGTPLWRVEWTEERNRKLDTMAHSHYTEAAARQHVKGLLGQVDPVLGNVYTEVIAGT